jgi:SNF2 family DNA or RNA helicase
MLACHPKLYDADSDAPPSKLHAFMRLVQDLHSNRHRALVFSQFTKHLALVRAALDAAAITYPYLDGQTPKGDREKRVTAFQRGEGALFLISVQAGGTGLNLTAADYVVHLDPWWNPAAQDQATGRAHRLGQDKPVTVYRLFAKDTIEERILALHRDKRDLAASVLDDACASGDGALSVEDLFQLAFG